MPQAPRREPNHRLRQPGDPRGTPGVFDYSSVRAAFPELTDAHIARFLDRLLFRGKLVRRVRHVLDYPRAPQDEPYIDLAATAKPDYLVSRVLSLMTGHSIVCKQFRQQTHPLRVIDPAAFLRLVPSSSP